MLTMKKGAVSPLYLHLACETLRNFASFEKVWYHFYKHATFHIDDCVYHIMPLYSVNLSYNIEHLKLKDSIGKNLIIIGANKC